jgi:outer membrane protein
MSASLRSLLLVVVCLGPSAHARGPAGAGAPRAAKPPVNTGDRTAARPAANAEPTDPDSSTAVAARAGKAPVTDAPAAKVPLTGAPAPDAVAGAQAPGAEPASTPAADGPAHWYGFSFRLGGLFLLPLGSSNEVELVNVSGPARLSVNNGPIAGSSVGLGNNLMFAATIGYAFPFLNQQLGLETVLALPFTMKLVAKGTLARQSLAPSALGNLPTGLPALGEELGETTVLPPVLTLVYRFLPTLPVHPYLGVGLSYLIPLSTKITNPVLTEVTQPRLQVDPKLGWVVQGGLDVQLYKWFHLTADVKYIGGLDLTATVRDIYVRLPSLPLYDAVRVGDNVAHLSVDPLVFQLGVGMNL